MDTVVVVGAGAAGVLAAVRLREQDLAVVMVDPAEKPGHGVAYSTTDSRHLLNTAAGKLSAHPDDPEHFVRWATTELGRPVGSGDFLPRRHFGQYLNAVAADITHVRDRVTGITRKTNGVTVELATGEVLDAKAAVLAIGLPAPSCDWAPVGLPGFIENPWRAEVAEDGDVLLVGSGLTMVDIALRLDRPHRTIHVVSRTGLLPRRHTSAGKPSTAQINAQDIDEIWQQASRGRGWRQAVDTLRLQAPRIWARLPKAEQERFLSHYARYWSVYRHRMAPEAADNLKAIKDAGRLKLYKGEVVAANGNEVTLSGGERLSVASVVNCTGPCLDFGRDPLIKRLFQQGLAKPGPHGLGLRTNTDGKVTRGIWAIGAARTGMVWESTAFPEIRAQATAIAKAIVDRSATKPRDRYGLALSTSKEAAGLFTDGVDRVLRGQCEALDDLVAATDVDPAFALGHAAIALLGLEWDVPVDVSDRLRQARTCAKNADSRERSFIAAVAARAADLRAGGRALLRHIEAHPRDAFAVNIAVPTISFGGITSDRETWELVESLAGDYGDDWWYLGQLAFVRQEQERWAEAEALSARALAVEPASGHAVHARTHVFYETGEHKSGLEWLNAWIGDWGDTSDGKVHFTWHAALHELMLGDDEAVRRRYARDLAPPAVSGPRALVDSASLLWRCEMTRRWDGKAGAEAVLNASPQDWLTQPQTSFAAMHAAIALAAAKDGERLEALRRFAVRHDSEVYRQVVAPLCSGLAHVVAERWDAAVSELNSVRPLVYRLGGSAAQREVIEDTFVHALAEAGRNEEAADVLTARSDRRPPSPLERGRLAGLRTPVSTDIHWQPTTVGKTARGEIKGHRPMVVWFTGLSGAGKSTIADILEKRLNAEGKHTYLLDGDNVRHGLSRDLGFGDSDRQENVRRVAEVAALMADAGLIVLVSFISPFSAERELARGLVAEGEFCEVFVDTPLAVAEARDPKGLYRKARKGELKDFTGVDSPYEPPERPEIRVDTTVQTAAQAAEAVLTQLRAMGV